MLQPRLQHVCATKFNSQDNWLCFGVSLFLPDVLLYWAQPYWFLEAWSYKAFSLPGYSWVSWTVAVTITLCQKPHDLKERQNFSSFSWLMTGGCLGEVWLLKTQSFPTPTCAAGALALGVSAFFRYFGSRALYTLIDIFEMIQWECQAQSTHSVSSFLMSSCSITCDCHRNSMLRNAGGWRRRNPQILWLSIFCSPIQGN